MEEVSVLLFRVGSGKLKKAAIERILRGLCDACRKVFLKMNQGHVAYYPPEIVERNLQKQILNIFKAFRGMQLSGIDNQQIIVMEMILLVVDPCGHLPLLNKDNFQVAVPVGRGIEIMPVLYQ